MSLELSYAEKLMCKVLLEVTSNGQECFTAINLAYHSFLNNPSKEKFNLFLIIVRYSRDTNIRLNKMIPRYASSCYKSTSLLSHKEAENLSSDDKKIRKCILKMIYKDRYEAIEYAFSMFEKDPTPNTLSILHSVLSYCKRKISN